MIGAVEPKVTRVTTSVQLIAVVLLALTPWQHCDSSSSSGLLERAL
jgi:hypothetical protein